MTANKLVICMKCSQAKCSGYDLFDFHARPRDLIQIVALFLFSANQGKIRKKQTHIPGNVNFPGREFTAKEE